MNTLQSPIGSFTLSRWPPADNDALRAWDAADEFLLQYVFGELDLMQTSSARILLINDSQGALATVLHSWLPQSWGDSVISHQAAAANFRLNHVDSSLFTVASTDKPDGPFDIVLIKIPKTTALLEEQLYLLRGRCHKHTKIVAGGMVKHLQKSAFTVFERFLGSVTTSLAKKKARLLFVELNSNLDSAPPPYPTSYLDPEVGRPLLNHANVFSRDHLDHGTRFLLQQFAALPVAEKVVDLACGNGVLGLVYQQKQAASSLLFVDESYSAIASARSNHIAWFPDGTRQAEFAVSDSLPANMDGMFDLVLCNPPFHQQHSLGLSVARRLFESAKHCLEQRGELWIVANRHLDYPPMLRHLFGNCQMIASNRRFCVYRAAKR